MSGHSKWHQIKRKKETVDARRGQVFTRLAALIKQAARAGHDPATNRELADAIARAKQANMPRASIDRLLQESKGILQPIILEAFGPAGTALLITGRTDNSRRTIAELRTILKDAGGSLGAPGSAAWKFRAGPGQYAAKYPLCLGTEQYRAVQRLKAALDNHPDIVQVFTDAVE